MPQNRSLLAGAITAYILRVIRASEFLAGTARWVANTVGMERRPVHQRLEDLHEQGDFQLSFKTREFAE
jgi:hypothetical protein